MSIASLVSGGVKSIKNFLAQHPQEVDAESGAAVPVLPADIYRGLRLPTKQPVEQPVTQRTIDAALDQVAVFEGGYVNDPDDAGGETNLGVTLKFLQTVQPGATSADLKSLTKPRARQLFLEHFVEKPKINELPDVAQAQAVALSVNAGPAQAIRVLQRAAGVKADGIVGPKTIEAVGRLSNDEITDAVDQFYIRLVERNPRNRKFLRGWLNRSRAMGMIPEDSDE